MEPSKITNVFEQISDFLSYGRYFSKESSHNLWSAMKKSPIVWSWGAHNPQHFSSPEDEELGAFMFKVQGHHFKGLVWLKVNYADTFDIYYTDENGKIQDYTSGVYVDQLVRTIDKKVEKIPAYKY